MFFFRPLKTIKRLFSLLSFLLLVFIVINFWAIIAWGEYFLINKYPRLEGVLGFALHQDNNQEKDLDYFIEINKIKVKAPIVEAESAEEDVIQDKLKQGVVWYPDTARPGLGGNMVLTGHSSDYFWKEGDWKTVFALLPKLEPGDIIVISQGDLKWKYKVKEKKIVSSNDLEVLNSVQQKSQLTLLTCWPPGTSWRRLAVVAELMP